MTNRIPKVVITSFGGITPVGSNIEKSCAAIHAGISRITEHAYFECTPEDLDWDEDLPLFSSVVPSIGPSFDGFERLSELAVPALLETLENSNLKRSDISKTALMLSLPQSDAATHNIGLADRFLPELCKRTGLNGFKQTKVNQTGRTGIFEHISDAIDLFVSGQVEFCIVGGIDSYLLESRLELLDEAWRIKSDRNVDGFIPGESAVMLMLETELHAKSRGVDPLTIITAVGRGIEPETILSRKASTGVGLSNAISDVNQQNQTTSGYQSVYCSLNGESYYAFEWGVQLTRLSHLFDNLKEVIHPAENCGDTGAATGALLLACATRAFQHGYSIGKETLLWTANDSGQRMALCLEQSTEQLN